MAERIVYPHAVPESGDMWRPFAAPRPWYERPEVVERVAAFLAG